ncbi:MAG: ribonuclease III [Treponema sp.]
MFPFRTSTLIDKDRKQELLTFQHIAGCKFKKIELLDLALHHRSSSNEHTGYPFNNERLEFLGDSILGMIIAEILYTRYPEKAEGELAKIKAAVVSEDALSAIALSLAVDKYIILGHGEELSGGRTKKAILADALEALIGALYLDSGLHSAYNFVVAAVSDHLELVVQNKHQHRDYKSLLQEYVQRHYKVIPKYELLNTSGPDHDRIFTVSVMIRNKQYAPASGKSKKEAEQAAAESAWMVLQKENSAP